jgi:hypothetical protein
VAPDDEAAALEEAAKERCEVPAYAYDCHTQKGRARGKTKNQFFIEEFEALKPREPGLFDHLVPKRA